MTRVEGRRIHFVAVAHDGTEQIGSVTHERIVVDLQRLARRLEAKGTPGKDSDSVIPLKPHQVAIIDHRSPR